MIVRIQEIWMMEMKMMMMMNSQKSWMRMTVTSLLALMELLTGCVPSHFRVELRLNLIALMATVAQVKAHVSQLQV